MTHRPNYSRAVVLAAILISSCRRDPAVATPTPAPATPVAQLPPTVSAPVSPAPAPTVTTPRPTVITQDSAKPLPKGSDVAPVYSPEEEQKRFRLVNGYRMELVAAEPLVQDPIAIDFDADGRMYVVEMRAYMPNIEGKGEDAPVGRVVVLEDLNDDGRMDRATVFMDSLVLPRAVKVTEHGVFVGAPPNLWLVHDTNGDLQADTRELIRSDYGDPRGNPEHNANGLYWGIDNWIHNANYGGQLRLGADGKVTFRKTVDEGQWGVSSDEFGRLYRNSNEDPLRADLIPSHYALRNPSLANPRGVYEQLTQNLPVWPAHKTPAINRGYRPQTMRVPDSTLAHYTSAGSPTAYIGDRLPAELRKSVFITESAGNMVGRLVINEDADGTVRAKTAYDREEFLTASDERFRPVNLANAPDGTLYVVDMYRGIIQHRTFITGYLEQKIIERGLTLPIGLGRIWRVVHTSTPRGEKPQLSRKTSAELVPMLAHPNGWWRSTAQRILVERGDRTVAGSLREMAHTNADARARLHALWTLDGIGAADSASIIRALSDSSAPVRAAALRIAEPWLARSGSVASAVAARIADRAPVVRRQLAATLGELPIESRVNALFQVVDNHGNDPVVADLVVGALQGHELEFLDRLASAKPSDAAHYGPVMRTLVRTLVASRNAAGVQRVVALAGETTRPRWQRFALLEGIRGDGGGRGFGGGGGPPGEGGRGGGFGGGAGGGIALTERPQSLLAAAASRDTALRARATRVADALTWPGKAATGPAIRPLTPAEQARFAAGRQQFLATCAGCHQAAGTGLAGVAKSLVGSRWVLGNPDALIRIVLHGKEGEMLMPPVGSALTSDQVAAVLTYIRNAWGNHASAIAPTAVSETAGAFTGRKKPWTEAELGAGRRRP
jgi:mono/diheme cytochrome c family protein/glucose/arabinose dehydrogenase